VLTLRVFTQSVSFHDDSSPKFESPQARIESHEPRTYEKDISSAPWRDRVALHLPPWPKAALLIPQAFSATAVDRSASNTF
jgi:hypothetical protein